MDLSIQEGRLRRQREKDTAELKQKQADRARERATNLRQTAIAWAHARHCNEPFDPAEFGFDFSTEEIIEAASHTVIGEKLPECEKYFSASSRDRVAQFRMKFRNRKAA